MTVGPRSLKMRHMGVAVGPNQGSDAPPDDIGRLDGPTPEEIQEPLLENLDRAITGVITAVPALRWCSSPGSCGTASCDWRDIVIFLVMYVPTGLGITVGFHRLLTHRSFKTSPWLRGLLACSARWPSRGR